MPLPPTGHSSSIDSASSFNSSKSSLLAPPLDEVSSQSDVADSVPPSMPRGDISAYGVAASPDHAAPRTNNTSAASISATQKLKRAFGKRRRPSHDAGALLSSGDERYASDFGPSTSSSHQLSSSHVTHSSSNRPSAAKLTMHLFGTRKPHESSLPDPNQPPPLPPKPTGLRGPVPTALQVPANIANKLSTHAHGSRPRSSVMATSPSITAAIEFMREDEERQRAAEQQRESTPTDIRRELEESKENWRKSDSTMGSGHTVRPINPQDAGPGAASKRLSAFLATPPSGGNMDLLEFLAGAPEPEGPRQDIRPVDAPTGKQSKRRSLSLNIHVPSSHASTSAPPAPMPTFTPSPYPTPRSTTDLGSMRNTHAPGYSVSLTSSPRETPTITRTPANGIISSGTASGSPVSRTNIRGRLAAWTATAGAGQRSHSPLSATAASTSSPSLTTPSTTSLHPTPPHRRVAVTSDASQPDAQAMAAVRQLQNRVRSPSGSSTSSSAGIRQAATSLTSGAGAMALGLGKRAYEKVGRVWGGSQSGSGSGSDTPSYRHPSPVSVNGASGSSQPQPPHNPSHGPSAFPPHSRRTPNAPSGTWSVSSMGGSRSSSEKDPAAGGRETPSSLAGPPMSSGLGRLVRPPRSSAGGAVFGRELWECVKETRAAVVGSARDPLAGRMIPGLVYRCAQHLHKWGIEEEGLFRISGRSSHITRLRNEFDGGADYDIIDCSPSELDPHAVASVFKAYLRELPEPILTRALAPLFDAAINAENSRAAPASPSGIISKTFVANGPTLPSGPRALPMMRKPPSLSTFTLPTSSSLRAPSSTLIETLGDLIARLPRENRDLLQSVVELMRATAARSKETKMPLSNLLLVFCPSLGMAPTLLRVFCDVLAIWEQKPPLVDISRVHVEDEDEDSDESVSDSDSEYGDEQLVLLPPNFKGKEKEAPIEDTQSTGPTSVPEPEVAEPQPEQVAALVPSPRSTRSVRRVPVPTLILDSQQMQASSLFIDRSSTPPLFDDPQPRSGSTPSLEVPSRSRTPSSPRQSEVSLKSVTELDNYVGIPPRTPPNSSPLQSSGFIPPASWAVPDHDKALPASPRLPTHPTDEPRATEQPPHRHTTQRTDERRSKRRGNETYTGSAPQLPVLDSVHPERSLSLPSPQLMASQSAPNVVFPSARTTPSTPTSLKKHALTLSLGRSPKLPDDEDLPSPSKRVVRRPSLNMLFNLKRTGSPSPRSRTPTISSPLSSPISLGQPPSSVELSPRTATDPFPPVLSLPIEGSMDVGLGWDDVFGSSGEVALVPPQPRPTAISQPSTQPPWSQPPLSPSRRPTTEYLISSTGFFGSNGPPMVLPSATAVLEAANSGAAAPSSPDASSDVVSHEDMSSGDDSPPVPHSPTEEPFSPPPHISFQLRRSSLEDEDWASAVLLAAGKPAESLA